MFEVSALNKSNMRVEKLYNNGGATLLSAIDGTARSRCYSLAHREICFAHGVAPSSCRISRHASLSSAKRETIAVSSLMLTAALEP